LEDSARQIAVSCIAARDWCQFGHVIFFLLHRHRVFGNGQLHLHTHFTWSQQLDMYNSCMNSLTTSWEAWEAWVRIPAEAIAGFFDSGRPLPRVGVLWTQWGCDSEGACSQISEKWKMYLTKKNSSLLLSKVLIHNSLTACNYITVLYLPPPPPPLLLMMITMSY
jgi:hypothetical protein